MKQVQQQLAFAACRAALLEAEGSEEADDEELEQRVRCKQQSREVVQLNSATAMAMLLEPILAKQLKARMRGDKEQWIEERSLQAAEAADSGCLAPAWGIVKSFRHMKRSARGTLSRTREADQPRASRRRRISG